MSEWQNRYMQIIPSINVKSFEEAKELIKKAAEFAQWIHIDVGDGIFTPNVSWGSPAELAQFRISNFAFRNLKFEVHLMVKNPETRIKSWLEAGANRIILHLESIKNLEGALDICNQFNAELGIAIAPQFSISNFEFQVLGKIKFFQILAVKPGLAGQEFLPEALEKIKLLRQQRPSAIIEVDGGINLETARLAKQAGADIVVSASYIWDNADSKEAYKSLIVI
jgi:ribulose-phosphate 3-epimerase